MSGDVGRIQSLIGQGAQINFRNRHGESPLTSAAAWDHEAAARLLLQRGADPNLPDRSGGTALMLAAQHASSGLVRQLINRGADVSAADSFGNTVVMHALWREHADDEQDQIVRELLKHGADVTTKNALNQTAATIARSRGLAHLQKLLAAPDLKAGRTAALPVGRNGTARKRRAAG